MFIHLIGRKSAFISINLGFQEGSKIKELTGTFSTVNSDTNQPAMGIVILKRTPSDVAPGDVSPCELTKGSEGYLQNIYIVNRLSYFILGPNIERYNPFELLPVNPSHDDAPKLSTVLDGTTDQFILVKSGTFERIGTQTPNHLVTVNDFLLSKYQLTFDEYDAFCKTTSRLLPNDEGWGRGTRPVINISWIDAIEYCNWRSQQEGLELVYIISQDYIAVNWSCNGYRLPTEAEWEYAARGGEFSQGLAYAGSDNIDEVAWYGSNSGGKTHPIGQKKANEL